MSNTDQGTREWRFYIQDMIEYGEKVLSTLRRLPLSLHPLRSLRESLSDPLPPHPKH